MKSILSLCLRWYPKSRRSLGVIQDIEEMADVFLERFSTNIRTISDDIICLLSLLKSLHANLEDWDGGKNLPKRQ
jgi:hypothetical protein